MEADGCVSVIFIGRIEPAEGVQIIDACLFAQIVFGGLNDGRIAASTATFLKLEVLLTISLDNRCHFWNGDTAVVDAVRKAELVGRELIASHTSAGAAIG